MRVRTPEEVREAMPDREGGRPPIHEVVDRPSLDEYRRWASKTPEERLWAAFCLNAFAENLSRGTKERDPRA